MPTKEITLNPGQSGELLFTFTPSEAKVYSVSINGLAGSFTALAALAMLYGDVKDARTFYEVEGVLVTLNGLTTYTGERPEYMFRYIFEGLTPGPYTITFSKDGYEPLTQEVTLASGTNELNVFLEPTGVAPELEMVDYSWPDSQPYEPSSAHPLSVTLRNVSTQEYTYELTLFGGARTIRDSVTLPGGTTATWEAMVTMPSAEGYHEFRLIATCGEYTQPFAVGTLEVRSPVPPPPEPEFSVRIYGGPQSVPRGEHIHLDVSVTNLSNVSARYDMALYLAGAPSAGTYFHMDPIPAKGTVTNPGPWFTRGINIMSPVAQSKTCSVCVMSRPTGLNRDCDSTVLTWY